MKKSSTLLFIFASSLIFFQAKAQIKNEMLWPLENGIQVPWFNGAYVDDQNNLVLIEEQSSNRACELVRLDSNFNVVKRESGFGCGAQQYLVYNGYEYLIQTDWGYDFTKGGGLGFRVSNRKLGMENWKQARVDHSPTSYDFYNGILAYTIKDKVIIFRDSTNIDTIVDANGLGFEQVSMLDSNSFVAVNAFESLQIGNKNGIIKSRKIDVENYVFVELDQNNHIFVLTQDSLIEYNATNLSQLNSIALKSFDTSYCKGLFIDDELIYAQKNNNLLAFDHQLNFKWSIDVSKTNLEIKDIVEFQRYTLISGNQGGFGFVKTFDIKTGKPTQKSCEFKITGQRNYLKTNDTNYTIQVRIENIGTETINSIYYLTFVDANGRWLENYSNQQKIENLNILPGKSEWIDLTSLRDSGSDPVFTKILIGMPNGIISGNGTKSISESNSANSIGKSELSNSITIWQNGFEITDQDLIQGHYQVTVFSIDGKIVENFKNQKSGQFALTTGVYIINLSTEQHKFTQKFVVE
jgi:hypothetical protein